MKENIILTSIIICSIIAAFCFLRKLILWLKVNRLSRIGFITSFVVFFSVHDVHNASSIESKKFRSANNYLNAFFWVALLGLAIVFVFNTSDVNGLIPTNKEKIDTRNK